MRLKGCFGSGKARCLSLVKLGLGPDVPGYGPVCRDGCAAEGFRLGF
jgi:hypothetical protein